MKKILITNFPDKYNELKKSCKIIGVNSFQQNKVPKEWLNYSSEYIPFKLSESIKNSNLNVAIDFQIDEDLKYLIAHHIITTYSDVFIFFFSDSDYRDELHLQNDYGLFRNKAIKCITFDSLKERFFSNEELERVSKIYYSEFDYKLYAKNYQNLITFDRHQITNEWGAIKLLLNHGITLSEIKKSYLIPETIYFKQKLREYQIEETTTIDFTAYSKNVDVITQKSIFASNISTVQKILLVDDNAERGWEFALKTFFSGAVVDTKFYLDDAKTIPDFSIYDLIFLDLRLPENSSSTLPDINNGLSLISIIKQNQNSLYVPLIIFTASEKARTLDQIIEYGADAMYVKESTKCTNEESFDNYLDFISELNFQINKGKELKKYWVGIQKIKSSLLSEINNHSGLLYEDRIMERLEMFYGLIKTKYEQSKFNKYKFHYSSNILSFMTLWSILNEIQEAYFEKTFSTITLPLASVPLLKTDGSTFKYLSKWSIKNQSSDIYFQKSNVGLKLLSNGQFKMRQNGDYDISTDLNCYFEYNPSTTPFYRTRKTGSTRGYITGRINQPEQKLSFQIAFILLEKNQLKTSPNLSLFLGILKTSNDQRNKLYLTHGEDSTTSFHMTLEKSKTLIPNSIEDLFKLIGFLLTSDECIL